MTDTTAQYRDRTSRELGLAGNHPDAITKHLDTYEASARATAYREAADLIEADDTCHQAAHREHYARLLRDKADQIHPA